MVSSVTAAVAVSSVVSDAAAAYGRRDGDEALRDFVLEAVGW